MMSILRTGTSVGNSVNISHKNMLSVVSTEANKGNNAKYYYICVVISETSIASIVNYYQRNSAKSLGN